MLRPVPCQELGGEARRQRTRFALATTIALAAALSACDQRSGVGNESVPVDPTPTSNPPVQSSSDLTTTTPATPSPSPPSSELTDPGPLAVLPSEFEGGLSAIVDGRLVFRGNCVYLNVPPSHGGPELHRVVWPTGTTWQERPRGVNLPNGDMLHEGDRLLAGGGFVRDSELALSIGDDIAARSFECDGARGTDVLSNDLSSWPD